ncbi:SAM-dependent methyltransferase [Reinekea marinisedimentorum]|uniref:Cyclopropane-fatty-acyl-phospholipid synthase n=1 Tax=Reinekea marinisedimentorum TaxID=230495 RepID=A0A4R3HZZ8_9GAMM|nr:cyclopropane-fatty-acyl-phospholipid synthase family protein [Reinekea marinisedimentorum]TCS37109.1 cyclopropane-fatty-acyl-phospholipid synthase [Reinekea marinisedimentorum]
MEQTFKLLSKEHHSWLTLRCRALVHYFFSQIDNGVLHIIEGNERFRFGRQPENAEPLTATLVVNDLAVYQQFIRGGSIGAAEAYMDEKWQTDNLTNVIRFFVRAQKVTDRVEKYFSWISAAKNKIFHRKRGNSVQGSKENILAHYDLGNELFGQFLDQEMAYSSAVFADESQTLDDAQLNKFKTICDALALQPEDHLLEIGTGWGGLAIYAAQHYGCKVTTTTISDAQHAYAEARIKDLGLQEQITLLKKDYRLLTGQYDKLVSVEMIEAVGYEHLNTFFKQCDALLKPQGKMLLQAITIADQRLKHYLNNVDFIQRYIFPGGFLPSVTLLTERLTKNTRMVTESISDIGLDYARTLNHWHQRFMENWPHICQHGYDDRFKNLWQFYLCYCEGAFMERATSTVHFVARKY